MNTTIEERVAILEKELTSLKQIIQGTLLEKDWRKTFGMSANDPGFDDMIRLGREIREQDQEDDDYLGGRTIPWVAGADPLAT
jgi:hypothetical protein